MSRRTKFLSFLKVCAALRGLELAFAAVAFVCVMLVSHITSPASDIQDVGPYFDFVRMVVTMALDGANPLLQFGLYMGLSAAVFIGAQATTRGLTEWNVPVANVLPVVAFFTSDMLDYYKAEKLLATEFMIVWGLVILFDALIARAVFKRLVTADSSTIASGRAFRGAVGEKVMLTDGELQAIRARLARADHDPSFAVHARQDIEALLKELSRHRT